MPVIIFLLWILLNGRVTPELVLLGLPITAVVYAFACRILGYSWRVDVKILQNFPLLVLYVIVLVREIIKAAFAVMRIAVAREVRLSPVITEFDSGLKGRFANAVLANSITLTPGTYTVFARDGHFVVHCLCREYADGFDELVFTRLLGKLSTERKGGGKTC